MNETLFITAIILGAIFLFIILFILLHKRGQNKKTAQQKILLADVVWKNKLQLLLQETINNYLLAVDKVNFILLYIDFGNEKEEVVLIDLWQVKTIKVTTEDNSIYEQRKGKSVLVDKQVSKLQLELTLIDEQQKKNLVLYEYKDGMQNLMEIKRRADYWCQLINKAVKELPHPSTQSSKYA
ncbi:hypothetical protein [Segetibacter aerophilus]|uniref:Uncharacterized protein n=1 Tax=Segetibacter aerophilus TaxID=670293 RepID=A0A512B776_9BACT|nr:hypothetical protein [Segetibacter aerophilus]GEO07810.1 hypothetical protein SAE01_03060 [Segetibacter aerophilus]